MKPSPFQYRQASSTSEVSELLAKNDGSIKLIAGGQSLGPMLNLRLVQPSLVLDITRLPDLKKISISEDALVIGACVTHANLEDLQWNNKTEEILSKVARGIAYRAIRNRGTIGGSIVHADPSADWLTALSALDAKLTVFSSYGEREISLREALKGPFELHLQVHEWVHSIRVPLLDPQELWRYVKLTRKTGEFSHAMSAVLWSPKKGRSRVVLGATESSPLVYEWDGSLSDDWMERVRNDLSKELTRRGIGDEIDNKIRLVALTRALSTLVNQ
jgi:carbon-monoxide dehydrogenase medium subunit